MDTNTAYLPRAFQLATAIYRHLAGARSVSLEGFEPHRAEVRHSALKEGADPAQADLLNVYLTLCDDHRESGHPPERVKDTLERIYRELWPCSDQTQEDVIGHVVGLMFNKEREIQDAVAPVPDVFRAAFNTSEEGGPS